MSAERYFIVPQSDMNVPMVRLEGTEAHHLAKVVRANEGESVTLLNGTGVICKAVVRKVDDAGLLLEIVSRSTVPRPFPVDIAIAVIKAGRMEQAVEKCTELGVRRIIPFVCERSVWKGGEAESRRKRNRLIRKVESACKQCGQPWFPKVEPVVQLEKIKEITSQYLKVFLADIDGNGFESSLPSGHGEGVLGIVGPEGGLTESESSMLEGVGALKVSLGHLRLRAETSAICLAYRLLSFGNGGGSPGRCTYMK